MAEELMSESQQQAEALVESIENEVDSIKILVKKLEKGQVINEKSTKEEIQENVGNCYIMIEGLDLQAQSLRKDKANHYIDLHNKFKRNLEDLENRANRAGGKKKKGQKSKDEDRAEFTKDEAIEYGEELIEDIESSARNAKIHLANMEEEAVKAAETVAHQRTQFEEMIDETYKIEDEMKRAKEITQIMLRRVATDQVMWCLIGLIFIGIIAIIVMKST